MSNVLMHRMASTYCVFHLGILTTKPRRGTMLKWSSKFLFFPTPTAHAGRVSEPSLPKTPRSKTVSLSGIQKREGASSSMAYLFLYREVTTVQTLIGNPVVHFPFSEPINCL